VWDSDRGRRREGSGSLASYHFGLAGRRRLKSATAAAMASTKPISPITVKAATKAAAEPNRTARPSATDTNTRRIAVNVPLGMELHYALLSRGSATDAQPPQSWHLAV
jgi:hypothetical protein